MTAYHKERLALFDLLARDWKGVVNGRFWTLDPRSLRFKHGETLTELRVPYHLGAEDEAVIEKAVAALALLVKRRFERTGEDEAVEVPSRLDVAISQPLREKTCRTDLLLHGSVEKRTATDTLLTTPFMDGAILTNWLGPDGHGRGFVRWISGLMEKAMKDEAGNPKGERTSYLALLSVINTVKKKKEMLKELRISGLSYDKLDAAVGFTLYNACRAALWGLFDRLKTEAVPYYSRTSEAVVKTALGPVMFLAIPSNIISTSLNPYGINRELFDSIEPLLPSMDEASGDSRTIISEMVDNVKKDAGLAEEIRLQINILRFRRLVLAYLMDFDSKGIEVHGTLREIYPDDRRIRGLLTDHRAAERLRDRLDEIRQRFPRDTKRLGAIGPLEDFLAGLHRSRGGWFRRQSREDSTEAVTECMERALSFWFDGFVERFVEPMRLVLVDRGLEYDDAVLAEEYNKGRLYRFSADSRPVLTVLAVEHEAQLFIDMKDFTRRTLKVKEIAMAEFMKENFYRPILDAAARHGMGEGLVETEGGIRLNSLPGDAAIFSGSVSRLISLARDIRCIIRLYRQKLEKRLPPVEDELLLGDVHDRFMGQKQRIREKRTELERALHRGDESAGARLSALTREERRLENIYHYEVEAAVSREMEAGLFISYGMKAETMVLRGGKGGGWPIMVAIGEKINEAARGTDRDRRVRARLEVMLEKERLGTGRADLGYPFDVYIDSTYSIRIPPELEETIEGLMERRRDVDIRAAATRLAREYYNDLVRLSRGKAVEDLALLESTTAIYNRGQALSREALRAYMEETRGTKFFFSKTVSADELDERILEQFYFPSEVMELWFSYELRGRTEVVEAFRRCGEVVFKGFESSGPTVVYEILDTEGDFFKALEAHHLKRWIEEAKEEKADEFVP